MARRIPEDRFDELVRKATEVFISRGFRLTQMSDIADAVGVAKGTLYGYVESKDALFVLCLRFADRVEPLEVPAQLPIAAPASGAVGVFVKDLLVAGTATPLLDAALASSRVPDVDSELRGVIGEFYDLLAANHRRIKLLDRCADHPELGEIWQSAGRETSRLAMTRYIESRSRSGQLGEVTDARQVARIVIETCTTWAVHIHWDRAPEIYEDESARANVIEFLVRGLVAR